MQSVAAPLALVAIIVTIGLLAGASPTRDATLVNSAASVAAGK